MGHNTLFLNVHCTGTFQLYDANHDGYISRQEMEDVVGSIYKMVGHMVTFPIDEATPQQRVDKLFAAMDTVIVTFWKYRHFSEFFFGVSVQWFWRQGSTVYKWSGGTN